MDYKFKASCIAVTVYDGHRKHCVIVGHSCEDDFPTEHLWGPEIDNSIYIDDIFCGYEEPPKIEGAWVWEGVVQPVEDDQPIYSGKWRAATIEDLSALIPKVQ